MLGWIRRASEKADRRFEKINIIYQLYHHLSKTENLQKVNCSIIGEIKFRGKKSVLSTGKPVSQDQKHKVAMKGLQIEYICQKKSNNKTNSKEGSGYLSRPEVTQNIVG